MGTSMDARRGDTRQEQVRLTVARAAETSAEALNRIETVRTAVAKISEEASSLSDLIRSLDEMGAADDPEEMLRRAGGAAEACAGVLDTMHMLELQTLLEMSERRALKMKFISMMVKTEAATASRSSAQTSGFADDLERLVGTVRDTTRSATKAAQPIPRKVNSARDSLNTASEILRRKSNALLSQKNIATGLLSARDYDMEEFEQEAQAISQASGQQIARLVPILQFSDAFTQRLENTKRFLDDAATCGADVRADASHLAALQLETLAADNQSERTAAAEAVNHLFDASMRSYQVMLSNKNKDAVQKWVAAAAAEVAVTADAIEISSKQLGDAFRRVDDALQATKEVTQTIREFDDLVHILHIEALNGAIAASHSDNTRSAAYVLAAEVRVAAGECAEILSACMDELGRIEGTLARLDRKGIEASVAALSEGLIQARARQSAQSENMQDQNASRKRLSAALQEVLAACRAARQTFHSSKTMERALQELAVALREEGSETINPENIAWIWPYYTTQPERELHTSITGSTAHGTDELDGEDEVDLDGFVL